MDKQKQIEKMENDIAVRMAMAKGIAGSMNNGVEGWLAEYLIEKGWEKIPEGCVVLTREEYDEYEKCKDLLKQYVDGELINEDIFARQVEELKEVRKETAEKFAEMAKARAVAREVGECPFGKYTVFHIVDESFDVICKEITGEKV